MDEELREELLEMAEADQHFRSTSDPSDIPAWRKAIAEEHARSARIAEIIADVGWPGRSLVGDDGASAAWLLVQHADRDVDLQERALALLEAAVAAGEAEPRDAAYLTDRARTGRGRKQLYGTQFRGDGATFEPLPIEDPDGLDARRAAAGLEPFAENEARVRAAAAALAARHGDG